MMDYDKIYERVVQRGDAILEQRRQKAIKIKQTSYAVSGLCAAAIVGVSVWHLSSSKDMTENDFSESNIVNEVESLTTTTTSKITTATTNKLVSSVSASTSVNIPVTTKGTQKQSITIATQKSEFQTVSTHKITENENNCTTTTSITTQNAGSVTINTNNNNDNPDVPSIKEIFLEIKVDIETDTKENVFKYYNSTSISINKELLETLLYEKHDIEIYSIKNISSNAAVAIKFKDDERYYFYHDKNYHSESLQGLIDDLALSSEGIDTTAYVRNKKYENLDTLQIWTMLTNKADISNDFQYCSNNDIIVVPKVSLSYTSPYISAISGSIGVSESGYISTNIGHTGSYYYIGEEKAREIIDYVTTNRIN